MANNYTQFAGSLHGLNTDEVRWLRHALRDVGKVFTDAKGEPITALLDPLRAAEPWRTDDWTPGGFNFDFSFDSEDKGTNLRIFAEENGDAYGAGLLVHNFYKLFRPKEIWCLTWADTCSKLRDGQFGGGAVIVTAKEVRQYSTYEWCDRATQHFLRTGELPPRRRKARKLKTGKFGAMNEAELIDNRGWSTDVLMQLMDTFIADRGLTEQYVNFLAHRAYEEEEECSVELNGDHRCAACDGFGFVVDPEDPEGKQNECEDCGGNGAIQCSPPCDMHKRA